MTNASLGSKVLCREKMLDVTLFGKKKQDNGFDAFCQAASAHFRQATAARKCPLSDYLDRYV